MECPLSLGHRAAPQWIYYNLRDAYPTTICATLLLTWSVSAKQGEKICHDKLRNRRAEVKLTAYFFVQTVQETLLVLYRDGTKTLGREKRAHASVDVVRQLGTRMKASCGTCADVCG